MTFRGDGETEIAASLGGVSAHEIVRTIGCGYAPDPVAAFDAAGGSASVSVAAPSACRWSATTGDDWIHIGAAATQTGSLPLAFTVAPNRSFAGRSGTIAVRNDQGTALASYPIAQRAAGCLYTTVAALTLTWQGTYDGAGDSPVAVAVHATPADCQWTATSSVSWARIVYNSERGIGDRTIYVSMWDWNSGPTRTGDIRIAGLSGVNPDAHLAVTQTSR